MQPVTLDKKVIKNAYRFVGHSSGVRTIIGWKSYIISGSDDKTIKIWNHQTGECIRTLYGHTERILCLEMWNGYLISGSVDTTIKIWDIVTGKCKYTIRDVKCGINCLISTNDYLFAGGKDGTIYMWNTNYRSAGHINAHSDWVNSLLAYNSDYLISCSEDKTVKLWKIATKECVFTFEGHKEAVKSICVNKSYLASTGSDFTIHIWNLKTGEKEKVLRNHCDVVSSLTVYNQYLISTDLSSLVVIWNTQKYKIEYELTLHSADVYKAIVLNSRLYTCSRDGSIVLWPPFNEFADLIKTLNLGSKEKKSSVKKTNYEEESILKLKEDISTLHLENNQLMQTQLELHEKLKKDYLTISSLNKELIERTDEMNQLRKECLQLRGQLAENKERMSTEVLSISKNTMISPYEIHSSFIRNANKLTTIHVGTWRYTPVVIKNYLYYKPKTEHRYDWFKSIESTLSLNHPNLVKVFGCSIIENKSLSIVMEFCPGSLKEIIEYTRRKKRILPLLTKLNILLQIASCIAYLHHQTQPISHGNLHPGNVLVSSTLTPLISDLFLVEPEQRILHKQYSYSFTAPECRVLNKPTTAADIFSLGCLILWVLTDGEKEVTPEMDYSLLDMPPDVQVMIQRCCNKIPSKRPSIDLLIKDLEYYKGNVEKECTRVVTSTHVMYEKSTGCYLFYPVCL